MSYCFLFTDTATTVIYTLSLHDALPISSDTAIVAGEVVLAAAVIYLAYKTIDRLREDAKAFDDIEGLERDRKSTRLNSSHLGISYAVFCLKKKTKKQASL